MDKHTTLADIKNWIAQFVAERDWNQYHQPKNLAMSISIEAAELMELFQWHHIETPAEVKADAEQMARIREELADVLAYCLSMANQLDIDIATALHQKIEKNARKYPVHQEIDWYNEVKT
ncbi:MAG: nucleotide pyrophosphohydrolase [Gemmatimonadetes bacterium]|nr:MAG: nucleotide pyrophosphohydrolase [Gemmatimonadota bacterium]